MSNAMVRPDSRVRGASRRSSWLWVAGRMVCAMMLVGACMAQSDAGKTQAISLAKEALAQKLSIAPQEIQVGSVTATDWPDSSLGCPTKGMVYVPVVTPGFQKM